MRVLIAHGDAESRGLLREAAADLTTLCLEPVESAEGRAAVEALLADDAPDLAVVDWELPGVAGADVCREVRARRRSGPPYIILIAPQDQVDEAFAAGADDCVLAGSGPHELQARLFAARRLAAQSSRTVGWPPTPAVAATAELRSPHVL